MRKSVVSLLCLMALFGSACGGSDDPTVPSSPTGATETTDPTDLPTDEPTEPADTCEDLSAATEASVLLLDNFYEPSCFIVSQEAALVLQNDGAAAHTFTIPNSPVDFELAPGAGQRVEGPAPVGPGEYVFYCKFHGSAAGGGMSGTVTIV